MEAKNFKPGQVWKSRNGMPVGIEQVSNDGGTHSVTGMSLADGETRSYQAGGQYLNDGDSDFDLVEMLKETDANGERATFIKVEGGEEMPEELKELLKGALGKAFGEAKEKVKAERKEADDRHFADHLIIAALEGGALDCGTAESLMKEIQTIIDLRKELRV